MNYRNFVFICIAAALSIGSAVALADECTDWTLQSDGSYWRICVDDNGTRYCEESKDGYVSRVGC